MPWQGTSLKPLSEPMKISFADTYMQHWCSMHAYWTKLMNHPYPYILKPCIAFQITWFDVYNQIISIASDTQLCTNTGCNHYCDVLMSTMVSQITSLTIVYSAVYSGTDQRKHKNSASLALVRGIHRWPVNSPHKVPVTRKMFPFDDVIIIQFSLWNQVHVCLRGIRFGPRQLKLWSIGQILYKMDDFIKIIFGMRMNLFPVIDYFMFLHARPWIPGDEKSIFTVVIH